MRYISIPAYIKKHLQNTSSIEEQSHMLKKNIENLLKVNEPLVSVIIPAYNEEQNILRTLSSLSSTISQKSVEIIVVDNNSSDNTKALVQLSGANYMFEPVPGVENARNKGLTNAKGQYIISADADTLYSPYWVDLMTDPLIKGTDIACSYGKFSFIPEPGYTRAGFFLYEQLGDIFKKINGITKDKAMYVYGCSSAYRKEQALSVNGYDHPPNTNEDGYLGVKLREKFGRLHQVTDKKSYAWTSSRKFVQDGTLTSRVFKKVKEMFY